MKVLNLRDNPDTTNAVLIDRRTKWGNPFIIGRDGTRDECCDKYRVYLRNNQELLDALSELVGYDLLCWCIPLRCHGYEIIEVMEERGLV